MHIRLKEISKKIDNTSNFDELKKITASLPSIGQLMSHYIREGVVKFEASYNDIGTTLGIALYKDINVAVIKAMMNINSSLEAHVHNVHEIIIVYEGLLHFVTDTVEIDIGPNEIIHFKPGEKHSVFAKENTKMIGITIPSAMEYPNAARKQ